MVFMLVKRVGVRWFIRLLFDTSFQLPRVSQRHSRQLDEAFYEDAAVSLPFGVVAAEKSDLASAVVWYLRPW